MAEETAEPTVERAADTRSRILATAQELFAARGYQRTSLRLIAERLGVSKATVLYHFPSKDQLLVVLAEPLVADLEAAVERAAGLPAPQARWAAVEGMLETFLAHRQTLLSARHDLALMTHRRDVYHRLFTVAIRAYDTIAGPGAGLAERVAAAQALASLSDPVVYFPDVPVAELRELILDGVRRLLGGHEPRPAAAPGGHEPRPAAGFDGRAARGRAGRPRALDAERVATARRMYAEGGRSVGQIAAELGVSRATLYRHLHRTGP